MIVQHKLKFRSKFYIVLTCFLLLRVIQKLAGKKDELEHRAQSQSKQDKSKGNHVPLDVLQVRSSVHDTRRFDDDHEEKRESVYAAYHEARKSRCDGCRYVPFYLEMYPKVRSVFDAGAANCGVMRLLNSKGFEVHGIEYSKWVVQNFCNDFLDEPRKIQVGPIHLASVYARTYDLVLCTDVLEHIPIVNIPDTIRMISSLAKPGGYVFLVIASDPSKHENHPERSAAAVELKTSGLKIHETVKPRSWWLRILSEYELNEDKESMSLFLRINQKTVHDPRYGYSIPNFKNRGYTKVYEPNERHVNRIYCLRKRKGKES